MNNLLFIATAKGGGIFPNDLCSPKMAIKIAQKTHSNERKREQDQTNNKEITQF